MLEEKALHSLGPGGREAKTFIPPSKGRRRWPVGKFGGTAFALLLALVFPLIIGCSSPQTDKIAFVSDRDGDPEIYIMDADGSGQTPLTHNATLDAEPVWSPDREWVAFISEESGDREINRTAVTGEEPVAERLTRSDGPDEMHRWSPDGGRIAFVSHRDGRPEIYLMNSEGTSLTRVTFDPSYPHLSGWSPDGQWIAFTVEPPDDDPGIIIRNPDGVNRRRLTNAEDFEPTWSPDGSRIAFTSRRDGNLEVYTMNSDGADQTRLTNNDAPDHDVTWSPDSSKLAFISERDGNSEIYVMNADGSSQTRHTFNDSLDESPAWSRNGKRIVFVSYIYGTGEIVVMDADGQNQTRLTNNSANDTQPAW